MLHIQATSIDQQASVFLGLPNRTGDQLRGLVSIFFLLLALGLSAATRVHAADDALIDDLLVDQSIRQLMQDRDYAAAIAAIDQAIEGQAASPDYLTYLKGTVLLFQKQHDAAAATFDQLRKQFPQSPWARRAHFAAAMALVRKGDHRGAESIYREEADALLSLDRKQEFVNILLEYADSFSKTAKDDQKPDYKQALEFYQRAAEFGPTPDKIVEIEMHIGRCYQELGNLAEAIAAYQKFVSVHRSSPRVIEARFRLGQCYLERKESKDARRAWEDLLAEHIGSTSDWVAQASYSLSKTWGIPQPETEQKLNLGIAALDDFVHRFPEHRLVGQAYLDIANSYVHRQRYPEAESRLEKFLSDERYRDRAEIPAARDLMGQSLQAQAKFSEALNVWRQFLARHPTDAATSAVQQRIIDAEYQFALDRYKAKDYDASRKLLTEFSAHYPLDRRGASIQFLLGQMHYEQRQWDAALAQWRRLIAKYPQTDEAFHAQFRIAQTLDEDLLQPDVALEEFRKVTGGGRLGESTAAIARLTGKSMSVTTERVFRSDEAPQLKLITRNISSVNVRVFQLNLESYFRKTHSSANVEALDIALIDPATAFDFAIPHYAKYQQLESIVELPMPGKDACGALAVTITSDTLESTTLVLRSDLDILVKSSRDEVFVFAENMRTGKPWPNALLLISDGQRIIGEAITGKDGVLQKQFDELRDAADVRVLAVSESHVASNIVGLEGVGAAQSLTAKGYIYTARPAYRAGERVEVRGCIRSVSNDEYVTPKGTRYTLAVLDPRNRAVWQQGVVLGDFGTFTVNFPLPDACPQGSYRVQIHDSDKHSYEGTFQVQEYKLEPVRLRIETQRQVYKRGEEIEGMIRAEYSYGTPLVGQEIKYEVIDNNSRYSGKTDERGELRFRIPTREFEENRPLILVATLPEWTIQDLIRVYVTTEDYYIELNAPPSVLMAGSTFELTVTTKDAQAKAISRPIKLQVLELKTIDGKVGELRQSEYAVETSAADGKSRQNLKFERGGQYRIRAMGTDSVGAAVTQQVDVLVSGADDQVRLRILADQHSFHVGDKTDVTLHWREEPALALVAFQGARVLEYRLVELQTGENRLPVEMTQRLAPNFDLAVTVMTDNRSAAKQTQQAVAASKRLYDNSAPFTVDRDLKVSLAFRRKNGLPGVPQPGESVDVSLTASDAQGRPAVAEFSLAMIEQSLLDQFPWPTPIHEFFKLNPRASTLRTSSSITFAYHPATRAINQLLLNEQERIELAQSETASKLRGLEHNAHGSRGGGMGGFGGGGFFGGQPPKPQTPSADFDALIQLIQSTIHPESRDRKQFKSVDFSTNLSLVVSQTQNITDRGEPTGETPAVAEAKLSDRLWDPTGYWNPSIVTGEDGKASFEVRLPDRATAWTLVAKGITRETLAGETEINLVAKKDLFAELKLPSAFHEGDEAEIIATIHNDAIANGTIEVTLATQISGRTVEDRQRLTVSAKGVHDLRFPVSLKRPESPANGARANAESTAVTFRLSMVVGERRETVERTVPLLPYGMTVYATSSGVADADTTVWVEANLKTPLQFPRLQIMVGPTVERSLLDVLFAPGPPWQRDRGRMCSVVETATNDLMSALALQKLFPNQSLASSPHAQSLDARIRAAIGSLQSAQNDNGGWDWNRTKGESERYVTARAVWSLILARRAGYAIDGEGYSRSLRYLTDQITSGGNDDQAKAILLHALSVAGEGDFSMANRLYRERHLLSSTAVLHLALAFVEMNREPIAEELLKGIKAQSFDEAVNGSSAGNQRPTAQSNVELRALYALALQAVTPQSPNTKESVDWLLSHRNGHRWLPDSATGLATLALCQWFATSRFEGERFQLAVQVNDADAQLLEMEPSADSQVIDVPGSALVEGKQRVRFELRGRGRYTYQLILAGFVPADQLQTTAAFSKIERTYTPAPLELNGHTIPRGNSIVQGKSSTFVRNSLTQLAVAQRGQVELHVSWQRSTEDQPEYLVVTEPVPSGAMVIKESVRGSFERFELTPGGITFYVDNRQGSATIQYDVFGYLPGTYRVSPTIVRNAIRPDQFAVSQPSKLTVLPLGRVSSDVYQLSPDELLELGTLAFKRREWKVAFDHLAKLVQTWNLNPNAYQSAIEMLLDCNLELGQAAEVVRYFEIIHEKWPDRQISFDKIVKVGAAYQELNEFERGYLVFRATIEGNFNRENRVAEFLVERNEFLRGVEIGRKLLREYPPEPYVASEHYALAQQVYGKAESAADDARLREAKVNRIDLILRAWRLFESFLTTYSEDPAADRVAFSAATALLGMEKFEEAAVAAERYARRYPTSSLLDSFWYIIGYARFAQGQDEQSLEMCRKVAEYKPVDTTTGQPLDSPNKLAAQYILGQIHHSLGKVPEAIQYYRQVQDSFPDARKSIDYFLHKSIALPEVTTIRPGKPVELSLSFRNLTTCDVKVYRIDLLKFALLRQTLSGITQINLSGIQPHYEATIELGDGQDYRDRAHTLELPLKDDGAYLVVCRGESLYTNGLVLLTPLELEVQHDSTAREVRTTVKDVVAGRYLNAAQVKVTGSGNVDFVSGNTDRRGLFVAAGIVGNSTVIAQAGPGRYAFYRDPAITTGSDSLAVRARGNIWRGGNRAGGVSTRSGVPVSNEGAMFEKINLALDSETNISIRDLPLVEFVRQLGELHHIPIQVDKKALEDAGVGSDTPLTENLQGISLRSALRLVLKVMDLTYVIDDGVLIITTIESAESQLTTTIYPVTDLVRFRNAAGEIWSDTDSLINVVTSTIAPVSWDLNGGSGAIEALELQNRDVLVVTQTSDLHHQIGHLLEKLGASSGTKLANGELPIKEKLPEGGDPFGSSTSGARSGMGGFGGGVMNGMPDALTHGAQRPSESQSANLLQGVQDTQRGLQGKQKKSGGGSGGGGFGGGGVSAGGIF